MPRSFPTSTHDAVRPARVCNEVDVLAEAGVGALIRAVRDEAGVIGDVDVQDALPAQFHEDEYIDEYIKDTESGRHHDKEVTSHNCLGVIAHEDQPALAGIGFRRGPWARYLPTVRGETWIPSFSFNSLAMCHSPQVGFSRAIWRIKAWRSFGRRGRPVGQDFHRQKRRNPLRCHRVSVSDLTTTKALRQSNHRLRKLSANGWNRRPGEVWSCAPETGPVACAETVFSFDCTPRPTRQCE
jgi:hypothetical protein